MTPPDDQLPAIIEPAALLTPAPADTYIVPALIGDLGDQAGWRYVEFFTANINNDHTRRAYARACNNDDPAIVTLVADIARRCQVSISHCELAVDLIISGIDRSRYFGRISARSANVSRS
jgi:hypothetical protein